MLAVIFLMVIAMISVRLMMATFAIAIASHLLLIGLEQWLDILSEVIDELIDIDLTARVSVNLNELVPQLLIEFR